MFSHIFLFSKRGHCGVTGPCVSYWRRVTSVLERGSVSPTQVGSCLLPSRGSVASVCYVTDRGWETGKGTSLGQGRERGPVDLVIPPLPSPLTKQCGLGQKCNLKENHSPSCSLKLYHLQSVFIHRLISSLKLPRFPRRPGSPSVGRGGQVRGSMLYLPSALRHHLLGFVPYGVLERRVGQPHYLWCQLHYQDDGKAVCCALNHKHGCHRVPAASTGKADSDWGQDALFLAR